MLEIFFMLLVGHALADYPLQGDFLARGKNHKAPLDGVPWWQCLAAHALIHGGMVYLITGVFWLGLAETVIHWFIDFGKSHGLYGFNTDQALHIACKILWTLMIVMGLTQ